MAENVGMSSCCLSGALHEGKPTGRVDTIGGLPTYIAEPKDGQKTKSIIFISDSTSHPPTTAGPLPRYPLGPFQLLPHPNASSFYNELAQ